MDSATPPAMLDPDRLPVPAFGLAEDSERMDTPWHHHRRPQLLYCIEGAMRLHSERHMVLLPPQRAAWIPPGCRHRAISGRPIRLRTVYFPPPAEGDLPTPEGSDLAVFTAPALLREMARQACAWGIAPGDRPEVASFFQAFLHLVHGWRHAGTLPPLPNARTDELARALVWMSARLEHAIGVEDAARAAGLSIRTLQRRCRDELGTSLQSWLVRARILHGMELLANRDLSVGEVALRCGYETQAAFTRAFHAETGKSPTAWRAADQG
jgi:AraC-like DNA-binding protein